MDNQKILNQAIELLKGLDLANAESVQINNTKFDDGSTLFEVGVSYPGTQEIAVSPIDIKLDGKAVGKAVAGFVEGERGKVLVGCVNSVTHVVDYVVPEGRELPLVKPLEDYTTRQLHDELSKRVGVTEVEVKPHVEAEIACSDGHTNFEKIKFSGPCRIILNQD